MRRLLWMCLLLWACDPGKTQAPRRSDPLARERGRVLYRQHCAICHGVLADGHGERASAFDRRPVDFSSGGWREAASASEVARVIREGRRGTPMPAWPLLSEDEVSDLTTYVLAVAEQGP